MKRFACIILIVALLICGLTFAKNTNATTVRGTLTTDTHWTLMDSPINFNGTVTVANNATLTIDPGVNVNLGFSSLYVTGTLIALGEANNQIVFSATTTYGNSTINGNAPIVFSTSSTPWSDTSNSGSIIQNANFNGVYLQINNAAPKIDNCLFNFASTYQSPISINGGSPTISNNIITCNAQNSGSNFACISIHGGAPLITNNHFEGNYPGSISNDINVNSGTPIITNNLFEAGYSSPDNHGVTVTSGAPQISKNQFEGKGYLNAVVVLSASSFTVSNNVFSNCKAGVNAHAGSGFMVEGNSFLGGTDGIVIADGASLTISNNLIDSNSRYGIDGGGYIDSNTITNNQIGIHNPPGGSISHNNIVGNKENSITAAASNVVAQNNWWGIADVQTINQTIYDAKVDNTLGTVSFVPFLTQPSSTAPAIPNMTPAITPVPTFQATPQPTKAVIIETPTPMPNQYSQTFIYQVGTVVNLNLIVTVTVIILILVWLVVILGYVATGRISKYRLQKKN